VVVKLSWITVVTAFFVSGLCAGACFGWLTTSPSFKYFWFTEGDKLLIPKHVYWIGLSMIFLFGLAVSYALSRLKGWLPISVSHFALRSVIAGLIVIASVPSLDLAGSFSSFETLDPSYLYVIAHLSFVLLISLALWVFTSKWNKWALVLMVIFALSATPLTVLLYKMFGLSNKWYDIVNFALKESLIAALCGYWLVKASHGMTPKLKSQLQVSSKT
jgi:hypothetical protein